jgi:hypothetical protein
VNRLRTEPQSSSRTGLQRLRVAAPWDTKDHLDAQQLVDAATCTRRPKVGFVLSKRSHVLIKMVVYPASGLV